MNKKVLMFAFAFIFIIVAISFSSANLGTFKHDTCIQIITVLNSSSVNLTNVNYPNGTIILTNKIMNKTGSMFNYSFCNTTTQGDYSYGYCDNQGNCYGNDFTITESGTKPATGGIIVLFIIFFILLVSLTCYLSIYTIAHLMTLDFDIIDLAFDWGVFFAILAFYFLEYTYLGNPMMEQYLTWFISLGGFLLILVPIIAFVFSITIGNLNKGKLDNTNAPTRFKLRRNR